MISKIRVQLELGNGQVEVRLLEPTEFLLNNFNALKNKVSELFPCLRGAIQIDLKWKDSEGDWITFSSDEELCVAVSCVTDGALRLHVSHAANLESSSNHGETSHEPLTQHFEGMNLAGDDEVEIINEKSDDENMGDVLHVGVVCDSCDGLVKGTRFKCALCLNYDLCESCESKGIHSQHPMLKLRESCDLRKMMREYRASRAGEERPPVPWIRRWLRQTHGQDSRTWFRELCTNKRKQSKEMDKVNEEGKTPEPNTGRDKKENVQRSDQCTKRKALRRMWMKQAAHEYGVPRPVLRFYMRSMHNTCRPIRRHMQEDTGKPDCGGRQPGWAKEWHGENMSAMRRNIWERKRQWMRQVTCGGDSTTPFLRRWMQKTTSNTGQECPRFRCPRAIGGWRRGGRCDPH